MKKPVFIMVALLVLVVFAVISMEAHAQSQNTQKVDVVNNHTNPIPVRLSGSIDVNSDSNEDSVAAALKILGVGGRTIGGPAWQKSKPGQQGLKIFECSPNFPETTLCITAVNMGQGLPELNFAARSLLIEEGSPITFCGTLGPHDNIKIKCFEKNAPQGCSVIWRIDAL